MDDVLQQSDLALPEKITIFTRKDIACCSADAGAIVLTDDFEVEASFNIGGYLISKLKDYVSVLGQRALLEISKKLMELLKGSSAGRETLEEEFRKQAMLRVEQKMKEYVSIVWGRDAEVVGSGLSPDDVCKIYDDLIKKDDEKCEALLEEHCLIFDSSKE